MLSAAEMVVDSRGISDAPDDAWESKEIIGLEGFDEDPYATRNFALTDRGRRYYSALARELQAESRDPESQEKLKRFNDRFASLPLRQPIRYVYQKYPEFTDKSRIRDDILG